MSTNKTPPPKQLSPAAPSNPVPLHLSCPLHLPPTPPPLPTPTQSVVLHPNPGPSRVTQPEIFVGVHPYTF